MNGMQVDVSVSLKVKFDRAAGFSIVPDNLVAMKLKLPNLMFIEYHFYS